MFEPTLLAAPSSLASRLAPRHAPATMQDNVPISTPLEVPEEPEPPFNLRTLAGVTPPLGFWDPAGFSEGQSEGKLRFYREVEIKHGRVAMLAAVGFPIAEQWHPLWGGNINEPSYLAFQQTPLQSFWPLVVFAIAVYETFSVFTFQRPFDFYYVEGGGPWTMKLDHPPGDMRFDPLSLKPSDPAALLEMETKELNVSASPFCGRSLLLRRVQS